MRKIISISIILLLISISCIYANENNTEINSDTNQEPSNQKYYAHALFGGKFYFYENGTTGEVAPWGVELMMKFLD